MCYGWGSKQLQIACRATWCVSWIAAESFPGAMRLMSQRPAASPPSPPSRPIVRAPFARATSRGLDDVRAASRGREGHYGVVRSGKRLALSRIDGIEAVVVGDACQCGCIGIQADCLQWRAVFTEASYEFLREVERFRCGAPVAARDHRASAIEDLAEAVGDRDDRVGLGCESPNGITSGFKPSLDDRGMVFAIAHVCDSPVGR